jgi:hypothetical protein
MPEARSISAQRRKSITALPDVQMIRGMPDLLDALRARREELQLTCERLDDIAGFPGGYSAKLLAKNPIKNLGWLSFGLALDSMGVALVMVENPEQIKRVKSRWVARQRPQPSAQQETSRHADRSR